MIRLSSIKCFLQQVAEAIAAVLEIEVAIIDENLQLQAGTGFYRDKIDMFFDQHSASSQVIKSGQPLVIESPREDPVCRLCADRDTCLDLANIDYPIKMEGVSIGAMGLVAHTTRQKKNILDNREKLQRYLEKMAGLIADALRAEEMTRRFQYLTEEFQTVINSIQEGIISVDCDGRIAYVNRSAVELLGAGGRQLINQHISEVLEGSQQILAVRHGSQPVEMELFSVNAPESRQFIGTVTYVQSPRQDQGLVISFRDIAEVPKMVRNYLSKERKFSFDDILGKSAAIVSAKHRALQVAANDSSVMITGESGTGKELFARAIHFASSRAKGPFVSINCGAIPEGLLESELFGYEEGAFSGAKKGGKPGRFELANNGTLFLDEIGDMPLHLQVKLLRVLEVRQVDRVGGIRPTDVNIRIIAATNKNLEELIKRGEFREDLYYRLSVIPLHIPPLRDRPEDAEVYQAHFIEKYNTLLQKKVTGISGEASECLKKYHWPGNVRELENVVEYAVNMSAGNLIDKACLPEKILREESRRDLPRLDEMERRLIVEALRDFGTSTEAKEKVARFLGISRSTLYRKISRYSINS